MGDVNIGGIPFRINPSQVELTYSVNTNVEPTVGGRVVQILGVTPGDIIIRGLYGQDRKNNKESGQIAEEFSEKIRKLVEIQGGLPSMAQLSGKDKTPMHPTHRFYYSDAAEAHSSGLPAHEWDFQVYVKGLSDMTDPAYTVSHRTGKYSYGYELRLFLVEDSTRKLATVAENQFLARLSNGVGWKQTEYNGPMSVANLEKFLKKNSPDGTIHGLVLQEFQQASGGQSGSSTDTKGKTK